VVAEYPYEQSVVDGVNVGYDVYEITTRITQQGAVVEAQQWVDHRDRQTRRKRWAETEEDIAYNGQQLDRSVVNPSQIRQVVQAMKTAVETQIFPTRKVTYSEKDAEGVLASFRNDYHPRIAVTVDMIATGTDVKPLEVLLFMRDVRSLSAEGLQRVSGSADGAKARFVLIDAVGVEKSLKTESRPLEKQPTVPLKDLLQGVALGVRDEIAALGFFYQQPYQRRALTFEMIEALHEHLSRPPLMLTTERL
jgi:type I restriction enzyme R subunit